jgi:predicted outer membrane protein
LVIVNLILLIVALAASTAGAQTVAGQEVDVDAGATDVEVDRDGVRVDTGLNAETNRPQFRRGERMNHQIASWLLIDQRKLVDLTQFGLERSKTPEVRQLLETILRDHESLMNQLDSAAELATAGDRDASATRRENRQTRREARQERDEARGAERRPLEDLGERLEQGIERLGESAERVVADAREGIDRLVEGEQASRRVADSPWLDIHREITEKLASVAQQDLEQRQGHEFDAALVGMLVAAHLQQQATLEVLSSRATGELADTLSKARDTVEQHRRHAEQAMNRIK